MIRAWTLILVLIAALTPFGAARAADEMLARWWGDIGLGYGHMSAPANSAATGGSGLWFDLQIGGRINNQWLAGLNISGLGMHASSATYDSNDYYSGVWGEQMSNAFLVVQYEPKSTHGWFFGAGAGETVYNNKVLEDFSGNSHSGNGPGGMVRIGYDWPHGNRGHFEAVLSYEGGNTALNAPFIGSFRYSIIAAGFHFAYH
jgi:Protein of unknown function (DUF3575)